MRQIRCSSFSPCASNSQPSLDETTWPSSSSSSSSCSASLWSTWAALVLLIAVVRSATIAMFTAADGFLIFFLLVHALARLLRFCVLACGIVTHRVPRDKGAIPIRKINKIKNGLKLKERGGKVRFTGLVMRICETGLKPISKHQNHPNHFVSAGFGYVR